MGLAYLLEPSFQIVDKSGNPLSNGFIEVYISGTSTKYYCYSDFNGSLHPFRIPLDAIGSNIILASSELLYDVFIYNSFGTLVMSRHRVEPISSTTTSGYAYILVEGTEGQIAVQATGSTDIKYKVGLDDAIINELSGIHSDISSTSAYLDNKINTEISNRTTADQYIQDQIDNLDIHNISIEQSGAGNAYTSFTKNGDTYTFNKDAVYLPSANAPVVIAGENVEVSSTNINGKMQYTIKANPAGNVTNLISTDETVSISATSVGNDVTYDLSVKDIAGDDGAKNYAFLQSEMPVNTSQQALEFTDIHTNGIHWNTIDQRLEFGENIKLIDLNYSLEYEIDSANGITYEDLILYIYSDGQLLEQETFTIDTSIAKHICKLNKKILDPSNLQFIVKVPKAGSIDAEIDVNDETFKSIAGGGGSTYYAGLNIEISDNVIIGRDWTPELNTKLDSSAFALPNSANWDNTYHTVSANSAAWSNPAITDVELYSSDGSLLINNTSSGDNVSYDLKLNEQLSAKNYFSVKNEAPGIPHVVTSADNYKVRFTTSEPRTDLSSNSHYDDWGEWITTEIVIPKEMKLFNVKIGFLPYPNSALSANYRINYFNLYMDNTYVDSLSIMSDNSYTGYNTVRNCLISNPMSADSILSLKSLGNDWYGWASICINDETYRSIGTSCSGIPDNYNSLYSTVSSNSATWNENGGTTYSAGSNINITDNVISGRDWTPELNTKLDTSAFTSPSAGNGIAITNDEISVKAGKGLGFDVDKKLEVKVGDGLTYDAENKVITINNEVGDVVESVNKLKQDLDTQIITNFAMPNISKVYDFADPSVSTLANGACMLCQAFTIPINNKIRTVSEDADEPTLLGIYAQQAFGHKIMLALYEYTYAKAGEEHGSSTYVGDTGPVNVLLGVNDYPLKNRNPSITELRSDKVYYATLYLPNAARVNGLMLAGAPNYGTQSVPSEPRLTCAVENITWDSQELDMSDPNTTLNHYQTYTVDDVTVYNYYIGPWNSGYNERWTAPRFYMQIRNGEFNEQIIPTAPFEDLGNVLPTGALQVSELPGFTASNANSSFRDVTPLKNVTITSFEWVDNMQYVAGWAAGNCVYDSGFATNLSNNNNTTSDLGSVGTVNGQTMYAHRITFNTPLTLTANTTYRFLCECFESSSSYIFGRSTPLNIVHCGNNGWYVDIQNLTRYDNNTGKYNKLTDSNNNSYVI